MTQLPDTQNPVGPTLDAIRGCLEGFVPAVLATCDTDGVPNVSMVSQVHYVDCEHVALSYQFFNKTRRNILATRTAAVSVIDPATMADYRLDLQFVETQSEGPLFETMKAKLAGIASHTGMEGIFHLRGADVMRVQAIAVVPGVRPELAVQLKSLLGAVRRTWGELVIARDLGELFDRTLACLRSHFAIGYAMVLMLDERAARLYAVATSGYARSGIGAEIAVGEGVIGVAARERTPIRIGHMSADYSYGAAVREQAREFGLGAPSGTEIAYPGLAAPESQIALPICRNGRILGVLFAESPEPMRFCYEDEDALALVADRLGELIGAVQTEEAPVAPSATAGALEPAQASIVVRHYRADDSIFLDHDYLIKGVAGAIFWKLVREHTEAGRVEFTNRELRLDPALRLPEHAENLEARLVLLQRRLKERTDAIRIERCGRGRFRLVTPGPLILEDIATGGLQASA